MTKISKEMVEQLITVETKKYFVAIPENCNKDSAHSFAKSVEPYVDEINEFSNRTRPVKVTFGGENPISVILFDKNELERPSYLQILTKLMSGNYQTVVAL